MKSWHVPAAVILVLCLGCGAHGLPHAADQAPAAASPQPSLLAGVSLWEQTIDEFVSSTTVDDWAATADVVAVGTVTAEHRLAPGKSASTEVDGPGPVGRRVTIELEDPLWSAAGSRRPPDRFKTVKYGWFETRTRARKMAVEDGSRLEIGGRYLLALVWTGATCSEDDGNKPAGWATIGSGAALPVQGDVLGIGELEGTQMTLAQVRAAVPKGSVADLYSGKNVARVGEALRAARVERTTEFQETYGTAETCPGLEE